MRMYEIIKIDRVPTTKKNRRGTNNVEVGLEEYLKQTDEDMMLSFSVTKSRT